LVICAETLIDSERAAPRDRPDVAVGQAVLRGRRLAGLVDLGHRVGDFEVEDLRRLEQPFGMLLKFEDLAPVHALALEHRGGVVQAVGEYVHRRLTPRDELAIQPDPTITVVHGNERHRAKPPWRGAIAATKTAALDAAATVGSNKMPRYPK
jgi:hypothetical protein